jgi:hypothetical protein
MGVKENHKLKQPKKKALKNISTKVTGKYRILQNKELTNLDDGI